MSKLEKVKQAYQELDGLLEKHKGFLHIRPEQVTEKKRLMIFITELGETYGLPVNLETIGNINWYRLTDFVTVANYTGSSNIRISWSDDNRQPEPDERLVIISFPTGPYALHSEYPQETFRKFFDKLKSYGAKYSDTTNHNLYFTLENSSEVVNNLPALMKEYRELGREEIKDNKKTKLLKELEALSK